MRASAGRIRVKRGFFITFEGTEGTGKSTQAALLERELHRRGKSVVLTREPGGTKLGEDLRAILLGHSHAGLSAGAELFLYMADRAQHVAETVTPALAEGKIVICDRFADATVAYQGFGRGLSLETIELLNREATSGRMPDLTLLLDMPNVEGALARALKRNSDEGISGREDRFEREEMEFHRRVQDGYRKVAEGEPQRFTLFSAALSIEELGSRILERVLEALPQADALRSGGVT
jgi:dTMP kinase